MCVRACVHGFVVCVWVGVGVFVCGVCIYVGECCVSLAPFSLSLSVQPPSFRVYWIHLLTTASRTTDPQYAGEHCKKIDLTIEQFYQATTSPPTLFCIRREHLLSNLPTITLKLVKGVVNDESHIAS